MTWILLAIFWGSLLSLIHSYLIFPALMVWLAKNKPSNSVQYTSVADSDLPTVSVLMSVFNEERVLKEKLESLVALAYPPHLLHIFVGSDCSEDGSHAIMADFSRRHPNIQVYFFEKRRGKPPVVNELAEIALAQQSNNPNHVFLMTDASVMLQPDTLWKLVRHFKNPKIGIVDAQMRSVGHIQEGISLSENTYMNRETKLKDAESRVWGLMIGPFGGCYALRASLFTPVPPNFLVDDFYIAFRVLEQGYHAINDLEAICLEGATHAISDEYRRKKRIAAGSFQNLSVFKNWVLPPTSRLGFAFFSHKVIRWFGGFLMAGCLLTGGLLFLYPGQWWTKLAWVGLLSIIVFVPLLQRLSKAFGLSVGLLKNAHYFLAMNLALCDGFFKYLRGIHTNVWQPTKRY